MGTHADGDGGLRTRGKTALVAVIALLAAVNLICLILAATGEIRLRLTSRPPGALVVLDGREVGRTPLVLPGLGEGRHRLRLEHDQYRASQQVIGMDALTASLGRRSRWALRLRRAAIPLHVRMVRIPHGGLVVNSTPAGAEVYVDNEFIGTTPLRRGTVPAGLRRLRLVAPGYETWAEPVEVKAGRTVTLAPTLRSRFVAYYRERVKKDPKDLTAYTELIHHEVVNGDFTSARELLKQAMEVAVALPEYERSKGRFFQELAKIVGRQYEYPEETKENSIRTFLRDLVGKAASEHPGDRTVTRALKQMGR